MAIIYCLISFLFLLIRNSPSQSLPDTVFWNDKDWPSDLNNGELKGTVLFAQSQIIPSKHGIENDNQPHLTALRKTLVMFQPKDYGNDELKSVVLKVRDASGTMIDGAESTIMNNPEDISKHAGWIELGGEVPIFPPSLDSPYLIQGQSNLNKIGNDPHAEGLTEILNTNQKEVEIKTWNGSWVRDIYVPDGSKIPADSKIQVTCNSGYNVNVHYPNTQTGGWRSRSISNGNILVLVLSNGGVWVAKDDLAHNEYAFGHGFYTAILDAQWVLPGMTLEFASQDGKVGILEDIDIGGITEIMITTLDAGFLTEPRDEFTFQKDSTTHREYFETTPASRLVVVEYETMHLTEVMLPTGKLYDTVSDTDGGWHSGDMRQFTGKLLLSHGIDLANYGISSSLGQSEKSHPFTCALFAAHNTVGMYQNGRQVHGGSGGNGMVTITASVGNEMSHEVGHNYGLGHYPGGFEGSVHRSSDEINSSWGWDSQSNIFIPNFSSKDTGEDQCLNDQCQSPFIGKFKYGKDSMAGGSPQWGSNRFTFYTPYVSKIIQEFLESRAVWDPTSSTGFRKYDPSTRKMKEFINTDNGNKTPRLYRVPVTTIVGYYDPDVTRSLQSYVFPAMHGAYGFVYDDDGGSGDGSNYECELVVKTNIGGTLVFDLSSAIDSQGMNKFHVNVATEDQPYEASIYCQNQLHTSRLLDGPKSDDPLTYTVNGVPFNDDVQPTPRPSNAPTLPPTESPTNKPTGDFTIYPNKTCQSNKNLGTSFSSPFECSEAAKAESSCTGKEIMWSDAYNWAWGCRCCYEHPTCPADSSRYGANNNWDLYEYEKCETTTIAPTNTPTLPPTSSPTKAPTLSPTISPTKAPTLPPTASPTKTPTLTPTSNPTKAPTLPPTASPTKAPTLPPTESPTKPPTLQPTENPTKPPTLAPTSYPTDPPTISPTLPPTSPPTEISTPEILTKYPDISCRNNKNLGTSFLTPEECVENAKAEPSCTGTEIMWSDSYNYAWGCRCCYEHPTCPADPSRYSTNNNWDVYEYESCATTTNIPTKSPTTLPSCRNVNVEILTDNYGSETTWKVVNTDSNLSAMTGGPYASGKLINESKCLFNGSYEFQIFDSYGDGICCDYGSGNYKLSLDDTVLKEGGKFGSYEKTPFDIV